MSHPGPGQSLKIFGYSSVLFKIHLSQVIYIRFTISLTTIVLPPIGLRLLVFSVWGVSKILEGSRFNFLQKNIVYENITKEFIQNLLDKKISVMITNNNS